MAVAAVASATAKAAKLLNKAMKSKGFWNYLLTAGFLGHEGLSQVSQAGDRGIKREELALQTLLGKSSAEATKREYTESRESSANMLSQLLSLRKEDMGRQRESEMMQSFQSSQDRQMAMLLSAIQGISQATSQSGVLPSSGMVNILRSDL